MHTSSNDTTSRAVAWRVGPPAWRAAAAAVPSRSAVRTMRRFLHAQRDGMVMENLLTSAAGLVSGEARRCALPAERMLVALKRVWWDLDEAHSLPRLEAQEWLNRLVTLSIRAYYEPGRVAGPPDGAGRGNGARTAR
jgi:hypothetical protein